MQFLAQLMGYKGEWVILSAASTATNQNAWIKYMKLEAKKAKYKNMKYDGIYYGNDNPAQSLQQTESLLQAHPNLKGIESPTTVGHLVGRAVPLEQAAVQGQDRAHRPRPPEPDEEVRP